jgi:hypothetical protein
MRAAPSFQVSLQRFGVWRAAVGLLAGLALTAIVAWVGSQERPIGAVVWAGAALGLLMAVLPAVSAARQRPVDLRWDGRTWYLGAATADPVPGDLTVTLDLGFWMLLRFRAASSGALVWLPAQRRGLEAPWHALRCAVHAPQPAPGDGAIGGR